MDDVDEHVARAVLDLGVGIGKRQIIRLAACSRSENSGSPLFPHPTKNEQTGAVNEAGGSEQTGQ